MSRAKITLQELSLEARLSADDAITTLAENGIWVSSLVDTIPRRKLAKARRALGLPAAIDKLTVQELAIQSELPEWEVRNLLLRKRLISEESTHISNTVARLAEATVKRERVAIRERLQSERVAQLQEEARLRRKEEKKARARVKKEETEIWPTVGHPVSSLEFLSAGDVDNIHWELVKDYARSRDPIEPPGVRSDLILESAIFRPHTAIGQNLKYPSVVMAAAALFHSLVHDHCFHNGNKRTALVTLLVFLDRNGYMLNVQEEEIFDYVLLVAKHGVLDDPPGPGTAYPDRETVAIARWLQSRVKQVRKGELCIKFRQLRQILTRYNCRLSDATHGFINIERDGHRVQIAYAGEGRDVNVSTIHSLRHDLELDEEHGYDSDIFYNASQRIPDFINKYRKTLDRLAKM